MSQYKEAPTDPAADKTATPGAETSAAHDLETVPEIDQLRAELEQARTEAGENLDRFLRAKAEAENTRRRAEADVTAAHKYALDRFAAEIISVRDSLDLARMVELPKDTSPAVQKMHEGLDLTLKLLDSVFQKFGVTLLDPKGQKFDPERHQAISMVDSVGGAAGPCGQRGAKRLSPERPAAAPGHGGGGPGRRPAPEKPAGEA